MTARPWIQRRPDDRLTAYRIAALTALETAVSVTAHALVITYPGVNRVERPCDSAELRTARDLIDDCDRVCVALDAHRQEILRQRHDDPDGDRAF